MNASTNTLKVLLKLAAIGETFQRKQANSLGANDYMMNRLSQHELIEPADGIYEWRITDKAYREITEIEKLVEQVK